ncbi:MAG: hypothetical protein KDB00_26600 [Planctomycetales bacterium]|nr:hypothetical protein [Planctomycetales bacterium]
MEQITAKLSQMKHALQVEIESQPNDSSCGPTSLAAVYRYWNDPMDLQSLIADIGELDGGGTLAVHLACHALARGYRACITTYNLHMFDPSWFRTQGDPSRGRPQCPDLADKLRRQLESKLGRDNVDAPRLRAATERYLEFLELGGQVQMRPLEEDWIADTLTAGIPILCGLSATYLYQESRERYQERDRQGRSSVPDDVAGDPTGHFVVLHGCDRQAGTVLIADPQHPNPYAPTNKYAAPLSRVTAAILLGIVTYDANLLTLEPGLGNKGIHQ